MRQFLLFIFLIFGCYFGYTQNIDSLWRVYKDKTQADTNRLRAIQAISFNLRNSNPDTAIILALQQLKTIGSFDVEKRKKWEAFAYSVIGTAYDTKGNYAKSLEYYLKALQLDEERGDKKGISSCFNNIGNVYRNQSNYLQALDYYLKSLKLREELGDKTGASTSYMNIGIVYSYQGVNATALEYFLKALHIDEASKDKEGIGNCYGNMGAVYFNMADYPKALECFLKSLHIREEIKDIQGIGNCYGNIGAIYKEQLNYKEALLYFFKDLNVCKDVGDKQGAGICYGNLGSLYNELANYKFALLYSDSELVICSEIGDIDGVREAYENLAAVYSKTGKYKEAYENHVKFKALTDSIFNTENSKQLGDMKTKFEIEKKEAELQVKATFEQDKLKAIANEEKKRQQVIIASVLGVLVVVLIFSLFLYKRFKVTERQKDIIEKQKQQVDEAYAMLHERNKEVMDSIYYARRIQRALITSEKYIENVFNRLIKNK